MLDRNLDGVLEGRSKGDVQHGTVERLPTAGDDVVGCHNVDCVVGNMDFIRLAGIIDRIPRLVQPETV